MSTNPDNVLKSDICMNSPLRRRFDTSDFIKKYNDQAILPEEVESEPYQIICQKHIVMGSKIYTNKELTTCIGRMGANRGVNVVYMDDDVCGFNGIINGQNDVWYVKRSGTKKLNNLNGISCTTGTYDLWDISSA